ncbi:MAG: 16S rRNA (guanine(527)-N(7))-methyltransferase RsmG [Acetobacteraceae bacterium]
MFHVKHERDQCIADFSLPPSVILRLDSFADLLSLWNTRINLVSRRELPNLWSRHIADSLQLIPLLPSPLSRAIDLGSGAGFPGLVLAIAAGIPFTLIEADQRKAAFLAEAARTTGTEVDIRNIEIAQAKVSPARLVTARALAPLPALLALAEPFVAVGGFALFPKGKKVAAELTAASRQWQMHVEQFPSRTDPAGSLLRVSEIRRVRANP